MTDETTARDRIEGIVTAHLERADIYGTGNLAYDIAREVLRALAGAPTADVAEDVVERVARKLHETSEMRQYTWDRAGASRRHGHWHDVMRARAREVLAAAAPAVEPEGVDVEAQGETSEVPVLADDVEAVSEAWRVAALADEQPESVEPYGRDELIEHLAVLWREERRRVARDEQDAKAQGEMANELTAAQEDDR